MKFLNWEASYFAQVLAAFCGENFYYNNYYLNYILLQ